MPNDPRFYETTFVMDSTKVTRTYADLLVYDYTKRGNNEGEKFWCLQAQVHDKRIVDHVEYSSHRVSDVIRAVKKMDPYLNNMRVWLFKYSAESTLQSKADNRPPTATEQAGLHSSTRPSNVLANGDPKPLDGNWTITRGFYPCITYCPYPDQVEFDVYYEPNDEHIMLRLPFGHITVATLKEALYKHLYPDKPELEGKYLHQLRIYYSGAIGRSDERSQPLPDKKRLAYQDLYPHEGSAGIYGCRLFTPTGEVWDRGEAALALNNDRPDIVKNLDPTLNRYEDAVGRIEGIDVQNQDVVYIEGGFLTPRRARTDLQPWDLARIPNSVYWKTTLAEEVYKYYPDKDSSDYKRALTVTSANGTVRFNWAATRRGDPVPDSTPSDADFPLRLSRASKFRRTA